MPKLTKKFIDSIKPTGRDQILWDDDLKGFGLRVKPSGAKSFCIQYRNAAGASKRQTLGQVGILTPDQARTAARERLAAVTLGSDPVHDRSQARNALSVRDLAIKYMEEAEAGRVITRRGVAKSASTLGTDRGRIERHIVPLIGNIRLPDLSRSDVQKMMADIEAGKTAQNKPSGNLRGRTLVTGGRGTAKRTVGLLAGILSWAMDQGYSDNNPAHGLRLPKDNRRHISNVRDVYAALGDALRTAEDRGEIGQAIRMIELGALTGMRRGEVINLRWSEVDFEDQSIKLATSKTGYSVRPLGNPAVDVLREIRELGYEGSFVFPAPRSEGPFGGLPGAWNRIIRSDELADRTRNALNDLTFHGLRHAFASRANLLGIQTPTISALLGHASTGVTAGYISHVDSALLQAANRVSESIESDMQFFDNVITPIEFSRAENTA